MFGYELLIFLASVAVARVMDIQLEKRFTKFKEEVSEELIKQIEDFDAYYKELCKELEKEREIFWREIRTEREEFRSFLEEVKQDLKRDDRQ